VTPKRAREKAVWVDDELHRRLKVLAAVNCVTTKAIVEEAIHEWANLRRVDGLPMRRRSISA
jgi:predicted transcriptional regulator